MPFLVTIFDERSAMFSPRGNWIAYVSNESGQDEVYVQPYPGPGGKWAISTGGGSEPVWSRQGGELFYRSGDRMMVVSVTTEPTFSSSAPQVLFEERYQPEITGNPGYDVSLDGKQFLMVKQTQRKAGLTVVLNWFEELKARVPTN